MEAIITGVVGVVAGAVIAQAAPKIVEGPASLLRGLAREVIKGGLVIQDSAASLFSGSGNVLSDLVAEARAELKSGSAAATAPAKVGAHK
ncbi:protein of unknown function [Nitrospira japonica]|uniref:DUF5132 domain-containing protein n=1 Tax=Nitrospira japonica TaxID=1325564 RepID=A0A1W1I928_9BACT|nr:DUF5132 domain-containing protein [Nitrospira japonica]SLM49500.1 protein of unknown function [Nitrospira japonica]